MKKLFTLATLSAIALVLPTVAFAAPKEATAGMKKAMEKPVAAADDAIKAVKSVSMNSRVDSIDAAKKRSHTQMRTEKRS